MYLTKLTASENGSASSPFLKNGFLGISGSSCDNRDVSVLLSEKFSDVRSTSSSDKLLVSDA